MNKDNIVYMSYLSSSQYTFVYGGRLWKTSLIF